MSCFQTFTDYGLRSVGLGVRGLPKSDISLCDQIVLIGSGERNVVGVDLGKHDRRTAGK